MKSFRFHRPPREPPLGNLKWLVLHVRQRPTLLSHHCFPFPTRDAQLALLTQPKPDGAILALSVIVSAVDCHGPLSSASFVKYEESHHFNTVDAVLPHVGRRDMVVVVVKHLFKRKRFALESGRNMEQNVRGSSSMYGNMPSHAATTIVWLDHSLLTVPATCVDQACRANYKPAQV